MYVSEPAVALGKINLQIERNAEAQSAQEQLRQAYANNEVHVQALRSEIAAAAVKSTEEPFCQSPILPRKISSYPGADTPPSFHAGSQLPMPGFAGDDSFTFENDSLARTSLTLSRAAASGSGGGAPQSLSPSSAPCDLFQAQGGKGWTLTNPCEECLAIAMSSDLN